MKKLTMEQLRELRVFNPHGFAGDVGWFVDFTAHSRQTMGSFGWSLHCPSGPNLKHRQGSFNHRYDIHARRINGSSRPEHFVQFIPLDEIGATPPKEWVKFMGAWWDAEFVKTRMAELVERYKARVTP